MIVISTGDFQIRWNDTVIVVQGKRKWKMAYWAKRVLHDYLISNDCIQHSGRIPTCNTQLEHFFYTAT